MTPLFTSYACDYCDGLKTVPYNTAYIVWHENDGAVTEEFVFPTRAIAERWRRDNRLQKAVVREVHTEAEIRWRFDRGMVKTIELADQLFEIYPDHRYPPGPRRAHLVAEHNRQERAA